MERQALEAAPGSLLTYAYSPEDSFKIGDEVECENGLFVAVASTDKEGATLLVHNSDLDRYVAGRVREWREPSSAEEAGVMAKEWAAFGARFRMGNPREAIARAGALADAAATFQARELGEGL